MLGLGRGFGFVSGSEEFGHLPPHSVITKTYCVLMALTRQDFDTADPRLKSGKTLREVSDAQSVVNWPSMQWEAG